MHRSHLKSIISSLPESPGIYKYYDSDQHLIYIGKAKNLKKRVNSYFTKNHHENRKTAVMVGKICDIQYTLVETEMDALLLENSLIKQYQPRFNISLKDDKTYPSLCIKNEHFPRIFATRQPVKDGSEYFGPYTSGHMMHTILDLIKASYPLRNCTFNLSEANIKSHKFKACLEYDIGNCLAPCIALQTEADYVQNVKEIKSILKGNLAEVKNRFKVLMKKASDELKFEEASRYKRKLELLENYQSRSTIVNDIKHDIDIFSIVSDEKFAFANYLKVSNGIIIQTQTFEIKKKLDESNEEMLSLAIAEVRDKYGSNSKEIIVPFELDWQDEHITITVPKIGEKKKLLDLSMKNAMYYKKEKMSQYEKLNPDFKVERILNQMKTDLRLTELPAHIECFDNSNLQGTNPVSACVVFKDAKPSKKDYRHFIPTTVVGPDDFATMREVVFRRYRGLLEEKQPLPNLIIIDGGKGQLSAAIESLKELNIYGKIPILGIAKRLEELYFPEDDLPLYIDKKSETLKIIQQLRDEAHRFGITHHRKRRNKNTLITELENIKGIGPSTAKLLLQELKSVKKIRETKQSELREIIGTTKAKLVWAFFNTVK
ncbi:MAG: excinuclease ABC subunit UvrC [Bacteroidota bacterium]|nr:excinuclease ABC subunit UvrC [Bacteroidota bacterium]